ncbi:MAG: aminotransferase class IV, partial [Pseudomonadota bacterium]|nr:aminotransferase class IV [Pseudomonadota bacterium]
MTTWIDGRAGTRIDCRDRGLQYGDGVFETMRVMGRKIRLLEHHLQRLYGACERLSIEPPDRMRLCKELTGIASRGSDGVLKLIVTRGVGARSYRVTGLERCTRIASWHPLPAAAADTRRRPVRVRVCGLRIGSNELLAGLKTLNRLESVMARAEWTDDRIW